MFLVRRVFAIINRKKTRINAVIYIGKLCVPYLLNSILMFLQNLSFYRGKRLLYIAVNDKINGVVKN